jgi:hypothetical protein
VWEGRGSGGGKKESPGDAEKKGRGCVDGKWVGRGEMEGQRMCRVEGYWDEG